MALENLNQEQKQAVEYVGGPLLIVAGAGTGKTTVITEKISYLIKSKLASPGEILALTFTDKSAAEMQERVDRTIDIGYSDMHISTFHTFCENFLQKHALDAGIPSRFKLLTDIDAWLLLRENLSRLKLNYYRPLGNPNSHIHELIKHFAKCKDEMISPEEYLKYAEDLHLNNDSVEISDASRLRELAEAYHAYNQLLLEKNSLDFADLIYYSVRLLRDNDRIRNKMRQKYKYILVDEFQDVNWSQYELVRLLSDAKNLCVVGDDDQSIYAFRGASVSNILRFKSDYPQSKEIVLNKNYRSGQKILDLAYAAIQNNNPERLESKLKIDKKLQSGRNMAADVELIHAPSAESEVKAVVEKIKSLKELDKDATWDDFAILVRANSHADQFTAALQKAAIPFEFLASSGLYKQSVVIDCLSYLKAVVDHHDSASIYRLLRLPFLSLSEDDMQKFLFLAAKKSLPYIEALKRSPEFLLSEDGTAVCAKILSLLAAGSRLERTEKATTVLYNFLEQSGYLAYLVAKENEGDRDSIRATYHLKQFFDYIGKYQEAVPGSHLYGFMEHFKYVLDAGDDGALYSPEDTADSVNILTVHAAKGLEFKYVFIVNLVEERFPIRERGQGIEIPTPLVKEQLPETDSHYAEERRLFYVAATRAKEKLFLSYADSYGGVRLKKVSRFLVEAGLAIPNAASKLEEENRHDYLKNNRQAPAEKYKVSYQLPKSFSFSQIKAYATCPYQYKLGFILKIPTRGNASFSFGQAMHLTMQKFYERVQELNKMEQGSLFAPSETKHTGGSKEVKVPTLDELLDLYKSSWIEDWYKSQAQREEYYKKGLDILRVYYKSQEGNWHVPALVESGFKIRVGDYQIKGRIDRIDVLNDNTLQIVDYKTGKSKEKVTGEEKEQLLIYQLAASTLPEFNYLGKVSKLTYLYLNDNVEVSFVGNEKEMEKLKEKLVKQIESINRGDFRPSPNSFTCRYCDFFNICEFRA